MLRNIIRTTGSAYTIFTRNVTTSLIRNNLNKLNPTPAAAAAASARLKLTNGKHNLDISVCEDGHSGSYSYPFVWLRDNCQCDKCFLKSSQSRAFLLRDLDIDIRPKHVEIDANDSITITWPDGHISTYCLDWLKERRFAEEKLRERRVFHVRPTTLWGEDMQDNVLKISYDEVINDDSGLYKFIVNLEEVGLQVITDAPKASGAIENIAKRVAFLKRNNYGETFTVKSKWNASNLAYTGATLGLHTDLPYYHYTPGVQMLHCINQTNEGGENLFADGFYAASIMKKEYPDLYKVLLDAEIDYYDIGEDAYHFHKLTMVPVIQEDENGMIHKITYNNQVRDSYLNLPLDRVYIFYKALTVFEKLINDSRCCITHKLENGEIACFHNYRVLHGRQGYTVHGSGERHLEGGYIDWDELRSRRRVLESELQI